MHEVDEQQLKQLELHRRKMTNAGPVRQPEGPGELDRARARRLRRAPGHEGLEARAAAGPGLVAGGGPAPPRTF